MGIGEKIAAAVAFPMVAAAASKKRKNFVGTRTRLYPGQLRTGDILIAQELGGSFSSALDANFVRAGQAVFSHFGRNTTASATSEHVVMITDDGTQKNVEAVSIGVTTSHWLSARKYLVYRYVGNRSQLPAEAVCIALLLSSDSLSVKAGEELVKYASMLKMAASVFRRKNAGHFTSKRIERLIDLCDALESGAKNSADLRKEGLGMICSELIVTCYEVASHRALGKGVLNVDPRAMTAKALEARLNSNSNFALQGVFIGNVPDNIDVRGHHPAIAEIVYREVAAGNAVIENKLDIDKEHSTVDATCVLRDAFKLQHSLNELNGHQWDLDTTVRYIAPSPASMFMGKYEAVYNRQGFNILSEVNAPKSNMVLMTDNSST